MKNPIVEYIVWCIAAILAIAFIAPKAAMASEAVQGYFCKTTYAFHNGDTIIEDQGAIILDWGDRFTIMNTNTGGAVESPKLEPIENGSKSFADDGKRKFSRSANARQFLMSIDDIMVTYDCNVNTPARVFEGDKFDLSF